MKRGQPAERMSFVRPSLTEESLAARKRKQAKLRLDRLVITATARQVLAFEDVFIALGQHLDEDWCDAREPIPPTNGETAPNGGWMRSQHRARNGTVFWILTDPGRFVTAVLLPEDF